MLRNTETTIRLADHHPVRWFAVHTAPRHEAQADRYLRARGYKTFFPHFSEWVEGNKRKSRFVQRAYLSRYLFVGLEDKPQQSIYDVNKQPGVSTVVYFGESPLEIPTEIMQELMSRADKRGEVYTAKHKKPKFDGLPGDMVRIAEHNPLWGLLGEIIRVDGNSRITVKLEKLFGAEREVTLSPADVGQLVRQSLSPTAAFGGPETALPQEQRRYASKP